MKIGIIGAGRVGCSIGKYLRTKDIELAGYYDVDSAAAKEAAEFTRTESFDSLKQLADQSQIIFITTPDSFIIPVWEQLKELSLTNQPRFLLSFKEKWKSVFRCDKAPA